MTKRAAEMILDTSALIAILRFEIEAPELARII